MAFKILIKRRYKGKSIKKISAAIRNARLGAMEHDGYITSETMWDHEDPNRVVVASMWQSFEHWENYRNSERRKSSEARFKSLLDGPTEYEVFIVGLNPHYSE